MFSFLKTQVEASTIAWIDDYLTHKTVRETEGLCVKPGGQQHRSATGDRTLPVSSQTASTKQTPSSAGILWWFWSEVIRWIRDGEEAEYRELVRSYVSWSGNNWLVTKQAFNQTRFLSWEKTWRWLRGIHFSELTRRTDWNGDWTVKPSIRDRLFAPKIICWGSSIRARDFKRLNNPTKDAGSVLGMSVKPPEVKGQRRRHRKDQENDVQTWASVLSQRLLKNCFNTDCYRRSFLPVSHQHLQEFQH